MRIDALLSEEATLAELGKRLKRYRKYRKLSQATLARDAGVGVATLRRIEDGKDSQLGSWLKILRALGLTASVDDLLPEAIRSPMEEAKADQRGRRRRSDAGGEGVWGDQKG
jgi:transcriptional regulator with XRE-family HTH domain